MIANAYVVVFFAVLSHISYGLHTSMTTTPQRTIQRYGSISGQRWGDFEGFDCTVLGPVATTFNHLGDYSPPLNENGEYESKEKKEYRLNMGKAIDVLRRQLPLVFMMSDLDFSIFANQITVTDTKQNKFQMQKSLYTGAIKSLRMASSFSSIYPAMNVRKVEYIEECSAIHCLVDVILPDAIKVDGQAAWEGSFFFGLDPHGLINAHTFDRKITNLRPNPLSTSSYPWLQSSPQWAEDIFSSPSPSPKRGLVTSYSADNNQHAASSESA